MPDVKKIAQGAYRKFKAWPAAARDRFCTELWASSTNEEGALVCYVYRRFAKSCGEREFRLFTRWLDRYVKELGPYRWPFPIAAGRVDRERAVADRGTGWVDEIEEPLEASRIGSRTGAFGEASSSHAGDFPNRGAVDSG
jgi:hypothetical protein